MAKFMVTIPDSYEADGGDPVGAITGALHGVGIPAETWRYDPGLWADGVRVTLGEETDGDTVDSLFGFLDNLNVCVRYEGHDIDGRVLNVCADADEAGGWQLLVLRPIDDDGELVPNTEPVQLRWDQLEALHLF
jgi:hypothetical protein